MTEIQNKWSKRRVVKLTCPAGSVCLVKRPGPELSLVTGQLQRTLRPLMDATKGEDGRSLEELGEELLEKMDEVTRKVFLDCARATVVACVVEPKLYLHPAGDQLGPDDIDTKDFWYIYGWHARGCPDVPVATTEGEVTVEAVENFPRKPESGVGIGDNGGDLPVAESVGAAGDS